MKLRIIWKDFAYYGFSNQDFKIITLLDVRSLLNSHI